MKVGDIEIHPVVDGMIRSTLPASKSFPDPESEAWREQHMFRPDGMIESTLGAFLVHTGERVVLVDAGAGPGIEGGYQPPVVDVDDDEDPFVEMFLAAGRPREDVSRLAAVFGGTQLVRGELPASLDALGVSREEVTDVVCTHLHFDHIGWLSDDGSPYFPNATVRCAAADLDYFLAGRGGGAVRLVGVPHADGARATRAGARPGRDLGLRHDDRCRVSTCGSRRVTRRAAAWSSSPTGSNAPCSSAT